MSSLHWTSSVASVGRCVVSDRKNEIGYDGVLAAGPNPRTANGTLSGIELAGRLFVHKLHSLLRRDRPVAQTPSVRGRLSGKKEQWGSFESRVITLQFALPGTARRTAAMDPGSYRCGRHNHKDKIDGI